MADYHNLIGCINFGETGGYISIPVFQRVGSNHLFIPRTDNNFSIQSFYEVSDLGFPIHSGLSEIKCKIGDEVLVPVYENQKVSFLKPHLNEEVFRQTFPDLSESIIEEFSLMIMRANQRTGLQENSLIELSFEDLEDSMLDTVRWVKQYLNELEREYTRRHVDEHRLQIYLDLRDKWLNKYIESASITAIKSIARTKTKPISSYQYRQLLQRRFLSSVGTEKYAPKTEIREYIKIVGVNLFERQTVGDKKFSNELLMHKNYLQNKIENEFNDIMVHYDNFFKYFSSSSNTLMPYFVEDIELSFLTLRLFGPHFFLKKEAINQLLELYKINHQLMEKLFNHEGRWDTFLKERQLSSYLLDICADNFQEFPHQPAPISRSSLELVSKLLELHTQFRIFREFILQWDPSRLENRYINEPYRYKIIIDISKVYYETHLGFHDDNKL